MPPVARLDLQACPLEYLRVVLAALDGPAGLAVLVAPVLAELRLTGEVEVEVRRASRRPGGPRQYDAQHVPVLVVGDQGAVEDELGRCFRREPGIHEGVRPRR